MPDQKLSYLKELLKKIDRNKGFCFIDSCGEKAIGSHTISKSRILEKLQESDEKHGVILLHLEDKPNVDFKKRTLSTYKNSERQLIKKGKSRASVFYGFCVDHDSHIFQELDNETYENTDKINFLHVYRAFALYVTKSNHQFSFLQNKILQNSISIKNPRTKDLNEGLENIDQLLNTIPDDDLLDFEAANPLVEEIRKMIQKDIIVDEAELRKSINLRLNEMKDEMFFPISGEIFKKKIAKIIDSSYLKIGIPENLIVELENILKYRIKENDHIKSIFNSACLDENYSVINYISRPIEGIYKITGNFVFSNVDKELFSLTFFPEFESNKTQIIIASLDYKKELLSHLKLMSDLEYKKLISTIIIQQGTNVFMSPSFFNQMGKEIKTELVSKKRNNNPRELNIFK